MDLWDDGVGLFCVDTHDDPAISGVRAIYPVAEDGEPGPL
jgi:hypothetical protein